MTAKSAIGQALSFLPKTGSDLGYRDYASMGLASKLVGAYADERLTGEQAQLVKDSISGYCSRLMQAEQTRRTGDDSEKGLSASAVEQLKGQLGARLLQGVRETLAANAEHARENGSAPQIDRRTADSLRKLFSEADLQSAGLLAQYRALTAPAYQTAGLQKSALTSALGQDVKRLELQLAAARGILQNAGLSCDHRA